MGINAFSVETIKREIFKYFPEHINGITYTTILVADSSTTETKLASDNLT